MEPRELEAYDLGLKRHGSVFILARWISWSTR
jgi:hypothetical protein